MPPITNMYGQSPHSSSGVAGSSEGTPDTRFTAFSPEDVRPVKAGGNQAGASLKDMQQDPFVTSTKSKLSAAVADFKPYASNVSNTEVFDFASSATAALPGQVQQLRELSARVTATLGSPHGNAGQPGPVKGTPQGTTNQAGTFSTDTNATRCIQVTSIYKADSSVHQTVINSIENFKKTGFKCAGAVRIEQGTAAVLVRYSNINDAAKVYTALKLELPKYAVEYISPAVFASVVNSPSKGSYSAHEGQVVLVLSYPIGTPYNKKSFEQGVIDLLSVEGDLFAWQKQAATEAGTFRMVVEYCDVTHAIRTIQRLNGHQIKFPQGDVVLNLELHTPDVAQASQRLGHMTTRTRRSTEQSNLTDTLGRLTLNSTPSIPGQPEAFAGAVPSPAILPYITSMGGNPAAFGLAPASLCNPIVMGGVYSAPIAFPQGYSSALQVQGYVDAGDFNSFPPGFGPNYAVVQNGHDHAFNQVAFQPQGYAQGFVQHHGHSNAFVHNRGTAYLNRPNNRRQNAVKASNHRKGGRYQDDDHATGQHNQVDIQRIKEGIDVRTTVMLRNIPNKVDQATLKQIVDESSFGRYDFMYLRIDFSNDCNVGYAFINFVDPLDIVDFVMARSNQKWYMFKSDKVAEVSYATIQGRDCLIQKFRNSSVMLEPPHYRPKLFFTIHDQGIGPVGEEEQFPQSDNASKLRRSCDNAEHVGLFAPSAGQHLRDEQRRRRSQFDRGTSLAERDEWKYLDYEDGSMHPAYRGYLKH